MKAIARNNTKEDEDRTQIAQEGMEGLRKTMPWMTEPKTIDELVKSGRLMVDQAPLFTS